MVITQGGRGGEGEGEGKKREMSERNRARETDRERKDITGRGDEKRTVRGLKFVP